MDVNAIDVPVFPCLDFQTVKAVPPSSEASQPIRTRQSGWQTLQPVTENGNVFITKLTQWAR